MKKFSKKGVLLFAGAMALCAFVMPSMASAASWGPIGRITRLTRPTSGFTSATPAAGSRRSARLRRLLRGCLSAADLRSRPGRSAGLHCDRSCPRGLSV